ncbi:hypothetical protein PIB30_052405 [Stylosanthes scabra]|uniref:Uncharacterized protein n=1 Tax=Stylosanthes scabra TaxID=79078 RepID=A0ABU6ZGX4_9FABA|nr:hypothetical protein [Stylosanthes scabra]
MTVLPLRLLLVVTWLFVISCLSKLNKLEDDSEDHLKCSAEDSCVPPWKITGAPESLELRRTRGGNSGAAPIMMWVEEEQVEVEEDQEKAKLRKKVVALKAKLKAMEGQMKISWFLGLLGWLGFLGLWLQK